jgi:2-polyprenyl-3-methyl-5-hydroxy-6-metoxy-1,4-benzoquinol methylase
MNPAKQNGTLIEMRRRNSESGPVVYPTVPPPDEWERVNREDHKKLLTQTIGAYGSSRLVSAYCKVRFKIININILEVLALCLRGRRRVLEVGCGFGLFGCYFSAMFPEIEYCGLDINSARIEAAKEAASRLGLENATFRCTDARELHLEDSYDAIMIIDLLHHIDDQSKRSLLATCARHLDDGGRLIIKDINTRPFWRLAFTWALDVGMTRGFDMWYWDEKAFQTALLKHFNRIDAFPIADWLPYPHIVYVGDSPALVQ